MPVYAIGDSITKSSPCGDAENCGIATTTAIV